MQVPRPIMEKDLQSEEKELTDDINSLTKKVCILIQHIVLLRIDTGSSSQNTSRSNLPMLRASCAISCVTRRYILSSLLTPIQFNSAPRA